MYAGSIRSVERGAYAARTTSRRTLGILVDAPRQRCASHAAVRAGRLRVLCGDLQEQDGGRDRYWRYRSQRKCLEFHLRASHPRRPRRAEGEAMSKKSEKIAKGFEEMLQQDVIGDQSVSWKDCVEVLDDLAAYCK